MNLLTWGVSLFFGVVLGLNAQVRCAGTVQDAAGKPLSGVAVELAPAGLQ